MMCDRLSSLPDSLLLHILSFLPIKQAVATSFLSKRWRPLWHSPPNLIIHDEKFHGREVFIQFVDFVLISRDLEFLKNFRLNCQSFHVSNDKINIWDDALINRKAEHLEIWLPCGFMNKLPSSVFNFSTIRVLKFKFVTISTLSSVNLPSLKVLHLSMVTLPDLNCLAMLLSGCALVERLVLTNLGMSDDGPMPETGKLNRLVTAVVHPNLVLLKALSNVTFLDFGTIWCSPGASEPPLWPPDADNMPTFDNLTRLKCYAAEWTKLVNCLHNFPKLQNFVVYEIFSTSPPQPILYVLPCLSSHLKEFTFGRFSWISETNEEFMKFILNNARVLRTIKISSGLMNRLSEKEILEIIKVLSVYPRVSVNCRFLCDVDARLSTKDYGIPGSSFDEYSLLDYRKMSRSSFCFCFCYTRLLFTYAALRFLPLIWFSVFWIIKWLFQLLSHVFCVELVFL